MLAQHRPDAEGGEGEQRPPRRPDARRAVVRGRVLFQFADALAKLGGQAVQLRNGDGGLVLALLQRGHEALVHLEQEAAGALIPLHLPWKKENPKLNTDKKENEIFLIYKEIQMGSVANQPLHKPKTEH
jgi:hypothetical protein